MIDPMIQQSSDQMIDPLVEQYLESPFARRLKALNCEHELKWILPYGAKAEEIVLRREKGEPLAYILGSWAFRAHEFKVRPGVLIPRPETEELVDLVLAHLATKPHDKLVIADLGAGSGCIGLSLALELAEVNQLKIILVESSPAALTILRENASWVSKLKPDVEIEIVPASWAEWAATASCSVDVIVSNPPYLSLQEFEALDSGVSDWEPLEALIPSSKGAEQNPEAPYREILQMAGTLLRAEGAFFLELGLSQPSWIEGYARDLNIFSNCSLAKDMCDKQRFFWGERSHG